MLFSAELWNLLFYCLQQLGVVLAVGAQTVVLIGYLGSMRDGIVDAKEAQFSRAVHTMLSAGIGLIIVSGLGITLLHVSAGEADIIFTPAYVFKWILIAIALVLRTLVTRPGLVEGLAGGTWYALFVLHILAPVTSWLNLALLYVLWLGGFMLVWWALRNIFTNKKGVILKKEVVKEPVKIEKKKSSSVPEVVVTPTPIPAAPPPPPISKPIPPPPPAPPSNVPRAPATSAVASPAGVTNTLPLQKDRLVTPMPPPNLPVAPAFAAASLPTPSSSPASLPKVPSELTAGLPTIRVMPKNADDLKKHL